jgi:hypothetical protein
MVIVPSIHRRSLNRFAAGVSGLQIADAAAKRQRWSGSDRVESQSFA